jgi:uncharacterized protein YkwD
MKPALLLLIIVFNFINQLSAQTLSEKYIQPDTCLSASEQALYQLITEYRKSKGLKQVKLSKSLSYVAKMHAIDQTNSYKHGKRCNLHSWSDNGNWTACCYTPDHKQAACMWNKPRELTNYKGDGYEIAFWSTYQYATPYDFAMDILKGWKSSPGHNDVIINKNTWKNTDWNAIGIGIYGEYANVWFGKLEDEEGICPCNKKPASD